MNPYTVFLLYLVAILGFVAITLALNGVLGPKPVSSALKMEDRNEAWYAAATRVYPAGTPEGDMIRGTVPTTRNPPPAPPAPPARPPAPPARPCRRCDEGCARAVRRSLTSFPLRNRLVATPGDVG